MSTLQAYGYDSYPYLHVARRMCVPYAEVLRYVMWLESGGIFLNLPAHRGVTELAIEAAFKGEMARRRAVLQG